MAESVAIGFIEINIPDMSWRIFLSPPQQGEDGERTGRGQGENRSRGPTLLAVARCAGISFRFVKSIRGERPLSLALSPLRRGEGNRDVLSANPFY